MTYRCLGAALAAALSSLPAQSLEAFADDLPASPGDLDVVQYGDVDGDRIPDVVALMDQDVLLSSGPAAFARGEMDVTQESLHDLAIVRPANGDRAWTFATNGGQLFLLEFADGLATRRATIGGPWQMVVSLEAWSPTAGGYGYLGLTDLFGNAFRMRVDTSSGQVDQIVQVAIDNTMAITHVGLADADGDGIPDLIKISPSSVEYFSTMGPQLNQVWGADSAISELFAGKQTTLRHGTGIEEWVIASHTNQGSVLRVIDSTSLSVAHAAGIDEIRGLAAMDYGASNDRQDVVLTGADTTNFVVTRIFERRATAGSGGELLDPPTTIHIGMFASISPPVAGDLDGDRDDDLWFARPDQGTAYLFAGTWGSNVDVRLDKALIDYPVLPKGPSAVDDPWFGGPVTIQIVPNGIPVGSTIEIRYWPLTAGNGEDEEPIASEYTLTATGIYDRGTVALVDFEADATMAEDDMFYIEVRVFAPETGTDADAPWASRFYICGWYHADQHAAEAYFLTAGLLDESHALEFRGGSAPIVNGGGRVRGGRIRKNN